MVGRMRPWANLHVGTHTEYQVEVAESSAPPSERLRGFHCMVRIESYRFPLWMVMEWIGEFPRTHRPEKR